MANAPFKTDQIRTAIAIAYTNAEYIADLALPRVQVGAREYKYTVFNKKDRFTANDASVGRKGKVNEVEMGADEASGMIRDYGLEDPIPQSDIDAAANTDYDPLSDSTEWLTDQIMLGREIRVANIVHAKANYENKDTISGSDQWTHADSDPIEQITDALESCIVRPNTMTLSGASALALRRNAAVVKAFNGTLGDSGLVPLSFLRELLELERILIGRAKHNTANKGQDMSLADIWKNHCALTYLNPQARPNRGLTFGWTAQFKTRVSGNRIDPDIGLEGGTRVRVGEMVEEKVVSSDAGYFLENVIAAS
ncbi:hypothetical protein [Gilvimarinus sp. 1_MG-2023]|uniref:hypothetical protein n=1 Tax=Gilvimarinus sp. 1_MG-2023 TaxID=3062638 RepID=UPI0026E215FF|nr:hypothetical protein [Gilvimarinus sp. 1_MG-2023]MDO6747207.1 hypothetical protein [Gilvimarinus sp. 1_MG-2023]